MFGLLVVRAQQRWNCVGIPQTHLLLAVASVSHPAPTLAIGGIPCERFQSAGVADDSRRHSNLELGIGDEPGVAIVILEDHFARAGSYVHSPDVVGLRIAVVQTDENLVAERLVGRQHAGLNGGKWRQIDFCASRLLRAVRRGCTSATLATLLFNRGSMV
jgi:hypothetical protein